MSEWGIGAYIESLESGRGWKDARTDVDTASLIARDPELANSFIEDRVIQGPHGPISLRIYLPNAPSGIGLVWVHGGGFVGGDLDSPEANWTSLALAARGVTVISVDYRKALHGIHFPIPSEDVLAAWQWAASEAAGLGVTSGRLHLGGASAGASLAAAVMKRLRDESAPLPSTALLVYPVLHFELPPASADAVESLARVNPIERFPPNDVRTMNLQYVGDEGLASHPYAFPGNGDLSGLPRLLVITSDADDLRSSGETFAERVMADGGEATLVNEPGSAHGHLDRPHSAEALASVEKMLEWMTATSSS